ncbi:MAG: hypothetical protein V4534_01575 [Myxococcota bacterium]
MSDIQNAFEAGNYALVRRLAKQNPTPEAADLMNRIKTDPKVIWAGVFAFIFAIIISALVLH